MIKRRSSLPRHSQPISCKPSESHSRSINQVLANPTPSHSARHHLRSYQKAHSSIPRATRTTQAASLAGPEAWAGSLLFPWRNHILCTLSQPSILIPMIAGRRLSVIASDVRQLHAGAPTQPSAAGGGTPCRIVVRVADCLCSRLKATLCY